MWKFKPLKKKINKKLKTPVGPENFEVDRPGYGHCTCKLSLKEKKKKKKS